MTIPSNAWQREGEEDSNFVAVYNELNQLVFAILIIQLDLQDSKRMMEYSANNNRCRTCCDFSTSSVIAGNKLAEV